MYKRLKPQDFFYVFGLPKQKIQIVKRKKEVKVFVELKCDFCKSTFRVSEYIASIGRKFCSKKCASHRTEI